MKNERNDIIIIIVLVLIILLLLGLLHRMKGQNNAGTVSNKEVLTESYLKKISTVSELSTYTAIYNGIAQVHNEQNPDQTDYYVTYEATVKAGIDFDKVDIAIDDENVIRMTLPPVYIIETNVDIASLDYIFLNDKANTSTVSQQAYKACEADAQLESEQHEGILNIAKQNAINVLTALARPMIDQLYEDGYTLIIE